MTVLKGTAGQQQTTTNSSHSFGGTARESPSSPATPSSPLSRLYYRITLCGPCARLHDCTTHDCTTARLHDCVRSWRKRANKTPTRSIAPWRRRGVVCGAVASFVHSFVRCRFTVANEVSTVSRQTDQRDQTDQTDRPTDRPTVWR